MARRVGYTRESSVGQSLKAQLVKLTACDKIYREKGTGVDGGRPQLKACLRFVRRGDTLVVTRLDRIARSALHLHRIYEQLQVKGVALKVIDEKLNTNSAAGRRLMGMLAHVVQLEKGLRIERQMDGIQSARERGVRFGRKPKLTPEQVVEMRSRRRQGVLIGTLMRDYGISKSSVYKHLDATANGFRFHRPPALTPEQIAEMLNRRRRGALIETLARDYGVSKPSVYRYLRQK
jgi:DNA invertase Pin-like site-specific DNA recombinase